MNFSQAFFPQLKYYFLTFHLRSVSIYGQFVWHSSDSMSKLYMSTTELATFHGMRQLKNYHLNWKSNKKKSFQEFVKCENYHNLSPLIHWKENFSSNVWDKSFHFFARQRRENFSIYPIEKTGNGACEGITFDLLRMEKTQ